MEDEILKFICWITGHDEDTIHQMWNDYFSSPKSKSIPMDAVVKPACETVEEKCLFCNKETTIDDMKYKNRRVCQKCTDIAMASYFDY